MTNEKLFEIAAAILVAHIGSGQQADEQRVLLPMVPDLLPSLFSAVREAWEASNGSARDDEGGGEEDVTTAH